MGLVFLVHEHTAPVVKHDGGVVRVTHGSAVKSSQLRRASGLQEATDELLGRDRLWLVAGAFHGLEVLVEGDDKIRVGADGAVGEFVVVHVVGDGLKAKLRGDELDASAALAGKFDEETDLSPVGSAHLTSGDFFVFQEDLIGESPDEFTGQQALPESQPWSRAAKHAHDHIRVDADNHQQR